MALESKIERFIFSILNSFLPQCSLSVSRSCTESYKLDSSRSDSFPQSSILHPQSFSIKPKVCIYIPTYNAAETIADTLESLINQTYQNIEIFVVDNHSTDNTLDVARPFSEAYQNVKILPFDENVGGEGNFTRCIQLAEGDYTGIFHADDVYTKEMVERQVDYLERNPNVAVAFTAAQDINGKGEVCGERKFPKDLLKGPCVCSCDFLTIFKSVLIHGNFLICSSALVRTKVYKEVGAWGKLQYLTSADLGVWLQILEKYPIGIIPEPLMKYRVSPSSTSFRILKTRTERHHKFLVLDDYLNRIPRENLSEDDRRNYVFLQLKDNVSRAIVFLLQKNRKEALELAKPFFSVNNVRAAVTSIHRLKIFLMGIIVYGFCHLPLSRLERKWIERLRYGRK